MFGVPDDDDDDYDYDYDYDDDMMMMLLMLLMMKTITRFPKSLGSLLSDVLLYVQGCVSDFTYPGDSCMCGISIFINTCWYPPLKQT